MNTKQIEELGVKALKVYIEKEFGNEAVLEDIRNKGNLEKQFGCDLILTVETQQYYIELKASKSKGLPTNIRFTHQTLATMYNAGALSEMIVAFVYNLVDGPEAAKYKFFRFGDFAPQEINIEPHFIIQPKKIIKSDSDRPRIRDSLDDVLKSGSPRYDIREIFETRVSKHMKLA